MSNNKLKKLNIGNPKNIFQLWLPNNPLLSCIQTTDPTLAKLKFITNNAGSVDPQVTFNTQCF
jgi:hypothetical protein